MENSWKKNLILFLALFLLGLTFIFCILLAWDIFHQTGKKVIFTMLCDAFFITGFTFAGFGALALISSTGFFDMLAYGFKSLGDLILIPLKVTKHEKYYEFVERRRERRKLHAQAFGLSRWALFLVGAFFILVSCSFLFFIYF